MKKGKGEAFLPHKLRFTVLIMKKGREKRHKSIRKRVMGTKERPRLSIYRSLKYIYAQLVDDTRGVTLASFSSLQIKENSSNRMESAKECGISIAVIAKKKKIKSCVFDRSGYKYHGRVKALAEGAREGGLNF